MSFQIHTAVFNANNTTGGVGSTSNYNTPIRTILEDAGDHILLVEASSYHALAYACLRGSCNITIGDNDPQLIEAGEAAEWTAGTLLDQDMLFELVSGKIVITGIRKPALP